jgi:hypothetical protein
MRGTVRSVPLARKLVIDLMHVSVPLVVVRRTMKLERLVKARATLAVRPGWSTLIAKAFSIVAHDEPWLRTFYMRWPWPHFYEVPKSVPMVAMVRDDFDDDVPLMLKVGPAAEMTLSEIEAVMREGKSAPFNAVSSFRRYVDVARLPLPLRRLLWWIALNVGRQRTNRFGTFWITSLASLGIETVVARTPGPSLISYGLVRGDHTMELLFHWDHRVFNGILAGRALARLEEVLNAEIADELLASRTPESLSA